MAKFILLFASINGAIAVMLGAFAAHGLKPHISASLLSAFETGSDYHLLHVIALIALAVLLLYLSVVSVWFKISAYCWMVGVVLFSGSLYGLALGAPSWFGPITPVGGFLLITGWIFFAIGVAKAPLRNVV